MAWSLGAALAQAPAPAPTATQAAASVEAEQAKPIRNSVRRRAAKLYLAGSKLYEAEKFEEAMHDYEAAAELDPGNTDYPLAVGVARSHAVTALIQAAAKDRNHGDTIAERAALAHALELDPSNAEVSLHLNAMGDDALKGQARPVYEQGAKSVGEEDELKPVPGIHSFHLRTDQREIVKLVFQSYGIETTVDESVRTTQSRLDLDNIGYAAAIRIVEMVTGTFHVPLDAHRVLVARDTKENRARFERLDLETVYLSGLTQTELSDVANLAKNVFDISQEATDSTAGTISLRAPEQTLTAFNETMRILLDGKNQVLLEVRMIQLGHTNARNTGLNPPQSMSVFNVAAEAQSIFTQNQALIQQIISSGLASPSDYWAILGILAASGQIPNSPLTSGIATFGGTLTNCGSTTYSCTGAATTFAVAPGTFSANLSLNSSDTRELDDLQLRLGDGETATLKSGTKYPIQTSSFSGIGSSLSSIAGLGGAGTSSNLQSLLASYSSSVPNIPQVEYQDLGLTLKAMPKVMRGQDVALTIDLKINALAGSSVDGNPILNNQSWSGVVTVKQGEAVVVISELDKSQSRAVSGMPGISEVPGLNDLTGKDDTKNYASLLIVITPHVVRGTQAAGHSPMMRVERGFQGRQ
jgi:Flp pilus assembly secretin CpaC